MNPARFGACSRQIVQPLLRREPACFQREIEWKIQIAVARSVISTDSLLIRRRFALRPPNASHRHLSWSRVR
jgi:hypothetical protein